MTQTTPELQQKQIRQAEELLFSGPQQAGFAKELFFGRFLSDAIIPYPKLSASEQAEGDAMVAEVRRFADEHIDPVAIDQQADIPQEVILGLGKVGVLGATIPKEFGGRGLSQQNYCRVMEIIGGRCASTAVFVNAHHSIGLRALQLFGTAGQKQKWLPGLTTGEQLAAFALTEPEAGSDASNVQTRATPTPDGRGYLLNGQKRYITNGGIAQVLTVMARTPDPSDPDGKVTAFLVTPDMPGFQVVEARMPKCGIRGTATARLAFYDMFVPRENVLGQVGKGLRLALTVLDFGRTTFGASCTGAARYCLNRAIAHANTRRQFGKTLGEFDLVRQKIAQAAANIFAMESATCHTAALIDRHAEDYMLETAMLKVFASDALWTIVNDTLQIFGGAGYFTDEPFERMMRDARINMIGEGANDVLRCFIAMVGLRGVGMEMQNIRDHMLTRPWEAWSLVRSKPQIPVLHSRLEPVARSLSQQIVKFARTCEVSLFRHREAILDHELVQALIGDIASELFLSSCVYSRLATLLNPANGQSPDPHDVEAGLLYLKSARRRNAQRFDELNDNDDLQLDRCASIFLNSSAAPPHS
jgi:alkylation response protein AidB-like acyl-CoA dehydrogenase